MARNDWPAIVAHAAAIVRSYDTGVTLRQLFYRLVSDGTLANTQTNYKGLSRYTAEARRAGTFPPLIDRGRTIHQATAFDGPEDARHWLTSIYRRDRTQGQDVSLFVGVEKAGMVVQLQSWFGERGVPVLALGGYSSQTYTDEVVAAVEDQGRPAVLVYAGDFDPSGEDIDRDFILRTGCFAKVIRVALNPEQVIQYELPHQPGKANDPRARAFTARHGELVQVELDALAPDDLRALYTETLNEWWDEDAYRRVLEQEAEDRRNL